MHIRYNFPCHRAKGVQYSPLSEWKQEIFQAGDLWEKVVNKFVLPNIHIIHISAKYACKYQFLTVYACSRFPAMFKTLWKYLNCCSHGAATISWKECVNVLCYCDRTTSLAKSVDVNRQTFFNRGKISSKCEFTLKGNKVLRGVKIVIKTIS